MVKPLRESIGDALRLTGGVLSVMAVGVGGVALVDATHPRVAYAAHALVDDQVGLGVKSHDLLSKVMSDGALGSFDTSGVALNYRQIEWKNGDVPKGLIVGLGRDIGFIYRDTTSAMRLLGAFDVNADGFPDVLYAVPGGLNPDNTEVLIAAMARGPMNSKNLTSGKVALIPIDGPQRDHFERVVSDSYAAIVIH